MKNKILSITAFCAASLIYSCKGPEGSVGPAGSAGPAGITGATGNTGAVGATGANGANGNANVVYSDWKSLTLDKLTGGKDLQGTTYINLALSPIDPKEPLFTKDAINTAAIFTYAKYNVVVTNQNNQTISLVERIKLITINTNVLSYFLIDGRNKDLQKSYSTLNLVNVEYGENYFNYLLLYNLGEFNAATNSNQYIPEFRGKDLAYFQNIGKNTHLIRHVVVYGSQKGRIASLNMNDYDEVKRVLNLRD